MRDEKFLLDYGMNRPGRLELFYYDLYQLSGDNILRAIYEQIADVEFVRDISGKVLGNATKRGSIDIQQIKHVLKSAFKQAVADGTRFVFCLDHFDMIPSSIDPGDELFLREMTHYVSFVIATERPLPELKHDRLVTSPFLNLLVLRNIGLLTRDEAMVLVTQPAAELEIQHRFTTDEIEFLLRGAGRQPYLLTIACEFLFELGMLHPQLKREIAVPGMRREVMLRLQELPAVSELCHLFWYQLSNYEQETLFRIARGEETTWERDQASIELLRRKAVIEDELRPRSYRIFSELFHDYVLRQDRVGDEGTEARLLRSLAPLDRRLLQYLLERPNQVVTFDELYEHLWGDTSASKRGLEAAIHRIRTRFRAIGEADEEYILNVRGKGYRYVATSDDSDGKR